MDMQNSHRFSVNKLLVFDTQPAGTVTSRRYGDPKGLQLLCGITHNMLVSWRFQGKLNIKLDTRSEVFQALHGALGKHQ